MGYSQLQVATHGEIGINAAGHLIGAAKSDITACLRQRRIPEEDSELSGWVHVSSCPH